MSPTGTITSSRNYDVYGNVRSGVNANGTSAHKFVGNLGHPSDNSTGLIYMQARYMDPATGRFVSEDPGRQGYDWYTYCGGNPANATDSNGREWKRPDLAAFLAFMTGWQFVQMAFQYVSLGAIGIATSAIIVATACFAYAAIGMCDFGSAIVVTLQVLSTMRPVILQMFGSAVPAEFTVARDAAIGLLTIGLVEAAYIASINSDAE